MIPHNYAGIEKMLVSQRKNELLELLARDGQLVASDLSAVYGVSEDTIRRDLRELAEQGKLQRVHGGALPSSPAVAEFAVRREIQSGGKKEIATAAARLVKPGQIVLIDGGTTAVLLAKSLPRDLRATVVTHSPSVAVELVDHAGLDVIILGGRLFKHSIVAMGVATLNALTELRADVFFMGVTGAHPATGFSTGDFEEARIKRSMMKQSAETIVLASSEKLNAASAFKIAELDEASAIIVDKKTSSATTRPFAKAGLRVVRA
jgi:DeoR/GlpR family transcriptional regulator of sugar metabolism